MVTKRRRTSKQLSPISSATKVISNHDLLTVILLNLPLKPLVRFKSVSKNWLSLISSPHFTRLHNLLPPSASALFFRSSPSRESNPNYQFIPIDDNGSLINAPFKNLDFIHDPSGSGVAVVQSCNGLLLCSSHGVVSEFPHLCRYYVCNPTTKQFAILPQIRYEYAPYSCGMSLAFDPTKSSHYKVVHVRRSEIRTSRELYQIEIYSSETKVWTVSGQPFMAPYSTDFRSRVYWNGSVHWQNMFPLSFWSEGPYSLHFKVDEERVERLPLPIKLDGMGERNADGEIFSSVSYLGESKGHWHLIDVPEDYSEDYSDLFNVYEMAKDYSGWFVKYQVDLNVVSNVFPEISKKMGRRCVFDVLSLVRREKDERDESFLVLEIPGGKVIRYNFVDKCVKKFWEFTPVGNKFLSTCGLRTQFVSRADGIFQYIESLVCV